MDPLTASLVASAGSQLIGPAVSRAGSWLSGRLFGSRKPPRNPYADALSGEVTQERRLQEMRDAQLRETRNSLVSLLADGDDYVQSLMKTTLEGAMPQFNAQLQRQRAGANRRGISTGDLGTAYEGSLTSAFDRNMRGVAAGLSMDAYQTRLRGTEGLFDTDVRLAEGSRNRMLDLLAGQRDYTTGVNNAMQAADQADGMGFAQLAGGILGQMRGRDAAPAATPKAPGDLTGAGFDLNEWARKNASNNNARLGEIFRSQSRGW